MYKPWVQNGVKKAHKRGYTGQGITVGVKDNYSPGYAWTPEGFIDTISHGELIEEIILSFAPDATIIRNPSKKQVREDCDIMTQSQGNIIVDHIEESWSFYNLNNKDIDVLYCTAAGNYTAVTESVNTGTVQALERSFDYIDGELVYREGNTNIIVGGVTHNNGNEPYLIKAGITGKDYVVAKTSGPSATQEWITRGGGTSFATPKVAGTAALLMSAYPWLPNIKIKEAILKTARPFRNYDEWLDGCGLLSINRAFKYCKELN